MANMAKTKKRRRHRSPRRNTNDHGSLVAAVLILYYLNELTQAQIAQRLGLNKARINAILQEARAQQKVHFRLKMPSDQELAGRLQLLIHKKVRNPKVVVVPANKIQNHKLRLSAIGREGAAELEELLRDKVSLAIDGGESVARVIESVTKIVKDLELFPVAGGPLMNPLTSVPTLIGRFLGVYGSMSGLRAHLLPEPSKSERRTAQDGAQIERTLDNAGAADVYLLGVGAIAKEGSDTANAILEELEIDPMTLVAQGVVGVAGYSAFDIEGKPVETELDDKVTKIDPTAFVEAARSKNRRVLLVAIGPKKARAIKAMLQHGWANVLITDQETAEEILGLEDGAEITPATRYRDRKTGVQPGAGPRVTSARIPI